MTLTINKVKGKIKILFIKFKKVTLFWNTSNNTEY